MYAICFDFPEQAGHPMFAGWSGEGVPGVAPTLKTAMFFDDEAAAESFLANSYGPETCSFGSVVEVPSP